MADWYNYKKEKDGRVGAEREREGFFGLHERQKETHHTQADRLDNFESGSDIILNSLARLRVYVSVTDMNLSVFINDAKSKAKAAYHTGTRNWHYEYAIDVADIDVTLRGRTVHIKIKPADEFDFEFVSSGNPVKTAVVDTTAGSFTTYVGCMVACHVALRDERLHVGSERILANKRDFAGVNLSIIKRPYQIQLVNEPVAYPNAQVKLGRVKAFDPLFESYAPFTPHQGPQILRDTEGPYSTISSIDVCGPFASFNSRDSNFDIPFESGHKKDPVKNAYIRGEMDWPRANGLQTVKDATFGERTFAIYMDEFNKIAVFPVDAIGPLNPTDFSLQNVPDVAVKVVTPDIPAWVLTPSIKSSLYTGTDIAIDVAETDWKFNHLGTKAVAVVYEREQYIHDATFWLSSVGAYPFDSAAFENYRRYLGIFADFTETFGQRTYSPYSYFAAPGIIELTIRIVLTGWNMLDFTAQVDVAVIRRPSLMPNEKARAPAAFFVGYVWHDLERRGFMNTAVKAGTMVALDMELWVQPRGTTGLNSVRQTLWSVVDVVKDEEILAFAGMPIMALDLTTLSMVFRIDAPEQITKTCPGLAGFGGTFGFKDIPFTIRTSGAMIVHSGEVREVLFPENATVQAKNLLNAYSKINGRAYLADLIQSTTGLVGSDFWFLVPLTTQYDGWVDADLVAYRDYWSRQLMDENFDFVAFIDPNNAAASGLFHYRSPIIALPPNGNKMVKWLNALGGDYSIGMWCEKPRWGWHQYMNLTATYVNMNPFATFMAHPNGTYAYWDNGWVHDRNGMPGDASVLRGIGRYDDPGGTGLDYQYDTLSSYNADLVEHVIFDRVHFEVRLKGGKRYQKDTTFRELYNKAVQNGNTALTLPASAEINTVELKDMRAQKFVCEKATFSNGITCIDFKVEWDGINCWYVDASYVSQNDSGLQPQVGTRGNFNALNLYAYWRATNYAGVGGTLIAPGTQRNLDGAHWHFRFANPLVIQSK